MAISNTQRKFIRRVHILPSLLTLGNFACGFFSVVFCLNALFFTTRAQVLEAARTAPPGTAVETFLGDPLSAAAGTASAQGRRSASGANARAASMLLWACVIVFGGMIFDMLDGKVARYLGAESAFGKELDSLADIVTFGLAPPVLVITQWIAVMPLGASWWGQVMIFGVVYAACAALRLARYNVYAAGADRNVFSGLPSPAAAGCVVTAVLLAEGDYAFVGAVCEWLSAATGGFIPTTQVKTRLLALFLLGIGLLMVTTVPFAHLANRYLTARRSFSLLILVVLYLALLWHEPRIILFVTFNGYLLIGLAGAARRAVKQGRRRDPGRS